MINMKIGFVITMYDEIDTVKQTLQVLKANDCISVVIQSDPNDSSKILDETSVNFYQKLPDLAGTKEEYLKEVRKEFEEQLQLAKQGNAEAQKEVGRMYMRGLGTLRDGKKALEWLAMSTRNGNSAAPYIIYYIFRDGVGGTEQCKKTVSN